MPHYVPQGMVGMNLVDTFEEEHMVTPTLPRYNTRARAQQHSANNSHHHTPRVFRPITFKNTQVFHAPPPPPSKTLTTSLWQML
jgi:hypothetical protein